MAVFQSLIPDFREKIPAGAILHVKVPSFFLSPALPTAYGILCSVRCCQAVSARRLNRDTAKRACVPEFIGSEAKRCNTVQISDPNGTSQVLPRLRLTLIPTYKCTITVNLRRDLGQVPDVFWGREKRQGE